MFVLDNNFVLDTITDRADKKEQYSRIIKYLLNNNLCAISSSSIHNLDHIFKKYYYEHYSDFKKLLKKVKIIKSPSYINYDDTLAIIDIEDYLIELSAKSMNGYVITSDKVFLENSDIALHPDDFWKIILNNKKSYQFIDLKTQYYHIYNKIEKNIDEVIKNTRFINGNEVREIEEKLANYVGVKYAVGVSSGTDALFMSLLAYDVNPGDAIFTTTFTFIATAEVIKLLGATPIFLDIDPETFNIDVNVLENKIKKVIKENKLNPKGIIPVDLFGQPADYDEINAIAKKYNLFVLEDAAQSFGASYKGKKACSLADIAATSFFPAKPLGCYGDGGMVFTNNKDIYEKLLSIRIHGKGSDKYDNVRTGLNGRLDTMQAAVLLAKLSIFDEEIELRQKVAERYSKALSDIVKTPLIRKYNVSAWAQYSVLHSNRDKIINKLKENGIPTAIYYPKPVHLQTAFKDLGYKIGDFPVAEKISNEIFSLPMYPYIKLEEQEKIIQEISNNF